MKLYAAKLILSPAAIRRLCVFDCYALHKIILDIFPDDRSPEMLQSHIPNGVQWVDKGEHIYGREIEILSIREPISSDFPDDVRFAFREIPSSYWNHTNYRFSCVANPVICKFDEALKKLKRVGLINDREISDWFTKKALHNGFKADVKLIDRKEKICFTKKNLCVTINGARLSGNLSVVDKERFMQCVAKGIGKERAFGYGLLQVIPFS